MSDQHEQTNERDDTYLHLHKLAQCYAILRALESVTPPGIVWESADEIPVDLLKQALARVLGRDGKIHPSDEDVEAARRDAAEI